MEIRTGYSIDSPNQLLVDWMPHIHSERRINERNLSLLHSARQILRLDPLFGRGVAGEVLAILC